MATSAGSEGFVACVWHATMRLSGCFSRRASGSVEGSAFLRCLPDPSPCTSSRVARAMCRAHVLPRVRSAIDAGNDVVARQRIPRLCRLPADPAARLLEANLSTGLLVSPPPVKKGLNMTRGPRACRRSQHGLGARSSSWLGLLGLTTGDCGTSRGCVQAPVYVNESRTRGCVEVSIASGPTSSQARAHSRRRRSSWQHPPLAGALHETNWSLRILSVGVRASDMSEARDHR